MYRDGTGELYLSCERNTDSLFCEIKHVRVASAQVLSQQWVLNVCDAMDPNAYLNFAEQEINRNQVETYSPASHRELSL